MDRETHLGAFTSAPLSMTMSNLTTMSLPPEQAAWRGTMTDSIFCETNVSGSSCGMETKMWDFKRRWVKGQVGERGKK
jgi:hypothetical protein